LSETDFIRLLSLGDSEHSKTKKVQTINLALAWHGLVHLQFNNRISRAPFSLAATSSHGWNFPQNA